MSCSLLRQRAAPNILTKASCLVRDGAGWGSLPDARWIRIEPAHCPPGLPTVHFLVTWVHKRRLLCPAIAVKKSSLGWSYWLLAPTLTRTAVGFSRRSRDRWPPLELDIFPPWCGHRTIDWLGSSACTGLPYLELSVAAYHHIRPSDSINTMPLARLGLPLATARSNWAYDGASSVQVMVPSV